MIENAIGNVIGLKAENSDIILLWIDTIAEGNLSKENSLYLLEHYLVRKQKELPYLEKSEVLEIVKQDVLLDFTKIIEENERLVAELLYKRWGKKIVDRLRLNEEINLPSLEDRILQL